MRVRITKRHINPALLIQCGLSPCNYWKLDNIRICRQSGPCVGVSRNGNFFARNLRDFPQKNVFANFCASFAHEAEQLWRNIPHCSASHATRFTHICAKLFAQKSKLRKKQHYSHKLNPCKKTIV